MATDPGALADLGAVDVRRAIGRKEVSPVELLEACIARIEAVNPAVNAVTATCYARAREEARAAEAAVRRGDTLPLLHGLPLAVKDLEETQGLLTTFGSPRFRGHVPQRDNGLVARLRAAGAIVIGKTNVPEMGAGANTRNPVWGATGNPYDPMKNAGGSSGGSAAALACGMVPLATGSDTGGSLRIPAALCGVVGMRPSPGLVPTDRRQLGWTPISVVGPMGRTVADACLQLAASATLDEADPLSYPVDSSAFAVPQEVDLGSLRVGWTEDFGICAVDVDIRRKFRERIAAMQHLFASCEQVRPDMGEADRCFDIVRAMSFVAGFRDAYEADPASLGPNPRANYELGAAMTMADVSWAQLEHTRIFRNFQAAMRGYDLVLSPVTPVSPFPWSEPYLREINGDALPNYYRWLALTYVVTLATNPAISLPCGLDANGMPFGLQVIGRFRGDRALLGAAHALEHAFRKLPGTATPRPSLEILATPVPSLKSIVTHPPEFGQDSAGPGMAAAV